MITCVLNAEVAGRNNQRVVIRGDMVEEISASRRTPRGAHVINARGGAVTPALWDHHVHVRSTAARRRSINVGDVRDRSTLWARIRAHSNDGPLRLIGYDSDRLGQLSLRDLEDGVPGAPPVRIQHRSGHHWVVNAAARALLTRQDVPVPSDGILWDEDHLMAQFPPIINDDDVADEFRRMRALGVVGAADLTATNDAAATESLRRAAMGSVSVSVAGTSEAARAGVVDGVKLIVHDHLGTTPEDLSAAMSIAPATPIALHVVTDTALALALAACRNQTDQGSVRFEHAFICPRSAIPAVVAAGVSIGVHPGFLVTQGDRLIEALDPSEQEIYQPLRELADAGIPLFGGTDSPFGTAHVWHAMQAAVDRRTPRGRILGAQHALTPEEAFALFTRDGLHGHAAPPAITVGDRAACVLDRPWSVARAHLGRTEVVSVVNS